MQDPSVTLGLEAAAQLRKALARDKVVDSMEDRLLKLREEMAKELEDIKLPPSEPPLNRAQRRALAKLQG